MCPLRWISYQQYIGLQWPPSIVLKSHWPCLDLLQGPKQLTGRGRNCHGGLNWQRPHHPEHPAPQRRIKPQTKSEYSLTGKTAGGIWTGRWQYLLWFLVLFHFLPFFFILVLRLFSLVLLFLNCNFCFCYFKCLTLYRVAGIACICCRVCHSAQAFSPLVLFMHVFFSSS